MSTNEAAARIFVQIASYRDPECQWTIRDLFETARYPGRITIGVCWQAVPEEDQHCFEVETRPNQVRVHRVHASKSKGLCWARQRTQRLWRGEEYTLQIDSHMRFVAGWDVELIRMLGRCPSPKAVLSTYPPAYTPPNNLSEPVLTRIHPGDFREDGTLSLEPRLLDKSCVADGPVPTAFCAGGFMFAPSRIISEVPYDPTVYFSGEEVLFSARAWTAGWDFYAPDAVVIYHYYGAREASGRHWADHASWVDNHRQSNERIQSVLGMADDANEADPPEVAKYPLGTARSLEAYEVFCGVDFRNRRVLRIPPSYGLKLPTEAVTVSESARLRMFGTGGVVVSEPNQEVYHLNTLATYLWCAAEEPREPKHLVRDLAKTFRLPAAEAESYVVNLLDDWARLGLLAKTECRPEVESGQGVTDRGVVSIPASALGRGQTCVLIPRADASWVNVGLVAEGLRSGCQLLAGPDARLDVAARGVVPGASARRVLAQAVAVGAAPVPVSRVVFPVYREDAPVALERLAPTEALSRLLGLTMAADSRVDCARVECMVALLEDCSAYELTFSAFDEATPFLFDEPVASPRTREEVPAHEMPLLQAGQAI